MRVYGSRVFWIRLACFFLFQYSVDIDLSVAGALLAYEIVVYVYNKGAAFWYSPIGRIEQQLNDSDFGDIL